MRIRNTQTGFAILELVLVVAVLAAAGLAAWYVYQKQQTVTPSNSSNNTTTASVTIPSAPQVKTSADLNSALTALDQADPSSDNADLTQLNSQASGF